MSYDPEVAAQQEDPELCALAARLARSPGQPIAVELHADRVQALAYQTEIEIDLTYQPGDIIRPETVRLVLGSAATTCMKAVDQFVAALQLPYAASRGWAELIEEIGDRSTGNRQLVLIADAGQLLKYEDRDRWRELVRALYGGPHCLGGGWTSVVLLDDEYGWERSRFGSAAAAEQFARTG
jgi:hypothetical protein